MKTTTSPAFRRARRSGFTLVEMIVATSISLMIVASLLSGFVWMIRVAEKGNHYAVVQHEAAQSVALVTRYIRNATSIDSVDNSGNWVRVIMPNGKTSQFSYIADPTASGLGRLTFLGDITQPATTNVVAAGLTKVMTYPVRNIFEKTGANSLRVAYRVSRPIRGTDCAAEVDTGIRLRNF